MQFLVTYDVATETPAGRRRLRHMAQACKNYGQRVQKSVFEISVDEMHLEKFIQAAVKIMDQKEDSLRIYRLMEPLEKYVRVYGWDTRLDFDKPLVI